MILPSAFAALDSSGETRRKMFNTLSAPRRGCQAMTELHPKVILPLLIREAGGG